MKKNVKSKSVKSSKKIKVTAEMTVINRNVAGIDLGSEEHWVCVPNGPGENIVRNFGVHTCDFRELVLFFRERGVTSVAVESTAVYWVPIYEFLVREGFDVVVVNSRHLKSVSGRPKTDVLDCQWIQRLHSYGLLQASFIPSDEICVLRGLTRQRADIISEMATYIHRIQKSLQLMNLRLEKAVSDIMGKTGTLIIERILAGERDPHKLAKLKDHRVHASREHIAAALDGNYREEHLFNLKQNYAAYRFLESQVMECDAEINRILYDLNKKVDANLVPPLPPTSGTRRSNRNRPHFDIRVPLYEIFGTDLTQVPGFQTSTVLTLLAEIGMDLSAFPTDKHFTSFLGLCVNKQITGGRVIRNSTRKVSSRAACAFRQAALSLKNSDCYLGTFYRRIRSRAGAMKAITATARKLAVIFYNMVKYGKAYKPVDPSVYEKKHQERELNKLMKRAKAMGYSLVMEAA